MRKYMHGIMDMGHFFSLKVILVLVIAVFVMSGCKDGKEELGKNSDVSVNEVESNQAEDGENKEEPLVIVEENTDLDRAVPSIIADRVRAIEEEDYDLYMSAITRNNQFFYNEQERWFMEMIDERIHDLSLEVESVEMIDENSGRVVIHQHHETNETFDFSYPLLFVREENGWMDYGYDFEILETDRFLVKYMEGEERVDEFRQMLDDAFDHLDLMYELKPLDDYEMKLFYSQEMLRQRCIPSNPWLFTGWSEPDESLKLFTGHPDTYKGYPGVVQHELVHHITIRMCNNNLPVWMLEGIAMFDGSAYYDKKDSSMLAEMTKRGVTQTIQDLELTDLGSDSVTRMDIVNYYDTSYLYMKYIHDVYGRDTMIALFEEAGKKPFHDSTLNQTFESNNQKTATEVFQTVLGRTKSELSQAYLEWLDENYDSF